MIRNFPYFEQKYPISLSEVYNFLGEISALFQPDQHGKNGNYQTLTFYYDTDRLELFEEKLQGEFSKAKIRLRFYRTDSASDWCNPRIELKLRNGLLVTKFRKDLNEENWQGILFPSIENKILEDLIFESSQTNAKRLLGKVFKPKTVIFYERKALNSSALPGFRITLDQELGFSPFLPGTDLNKYVFRNLLSTTANSILELKANSNIPEILLNKLKERNIIQQSFSKFHAGMEQII